MKNFLKKITYDPYVDWLVIFCFGVFGIILSIIWSYITYQKVNNVEIVPTIKKVTKTTEFDIKKLDETAALFKEKKKIFDSPSLINIDVRDPSL